MRQEVSDGLETGLGHADRDEILLYIIKVFVVTVPPVLLWGLWKQHVTQTILRLTV